MRTTGVKRGDGHHRKEENEWGTCRRFLRKNVGLVESKGGVEHRE